MIRGWTDLKCPYCGFTIGVFIYQNISDEELKIVKECPCGKQMEDVQEIKARMERNGIKEKSFYTLIRKGKAGEEHTLALKKAGVEFEKSGVTLYAYSKGNYCHIIDPETGLSICTAECSLDTIKRHVSRNGVKFLIGQRENNKAEYAKRKKEFAEAERIETLDGEE